MSTAELDVAIATGSQSDVEIISKALEVLSNFDIRAELRVLSAHRTPQEVTEWIAQCEERGVKVFIGSAGMAAHLAGVIAAHTVKPVFGVPLPGGISDGLDSLLATVQMPKGIPVATFAVGKAGAINAALAAVSVMSLSRPELQQKLVEFRAEEKAKILQIEPQVV